MPLDWTQYQGKAPGLRKRARALLDEQQRDQVCDHERTEAAPQQPQPQAVEAAQPDLAGMERKG